MTDETTTTQKPAKPDWDKLNPDITRSGKHIVLPADPSEMSIKDAMKALDRKDKEENQKVNIHEIIDGFPTDALVAVNFAMQEIYGWASPVPTPGFWGPTPPQMLTIKTGPRPEDKVVVPLGAYMLPGVEDPINTTFHSSPEHGGACLVVYGTLKRKDVGVVMKVVTLARHILKQRSIYKGKPIQLSLNGNLEIDTHRPPVFMEGIDDVRQEQLVLNAPEMAAIEASLWTPIKYTANCRKHKIPLKRGILLEGRYGIGKTMTARTTAKICQDNGWTFIMLSDVRGLRSALEFARRYQPAVVFAEDIDRAIADRDDVGNDLINTIDGVVNSRDEVIVVLTTNYVEKLDRSMLRPGRLDAVVRIKTPNVESAKRLILNYSQSALVPGTDVTEAATQLADSQAIPATIREVVERAKLNMLASGRDSIGADDLNIAALSMVEHMALLAEPKEGTTKYERLGRALEEVLRVTEVEEQADYIEAMTERLCDRHDIEYEDLQD